MAWATSRPSRSGTHDAISELERFHRLVESLDAIFWEADADDLELTFLGGRLDVLFAEDAGRWEGRAWGDHILDVDRLGGRGDPSRDRRGCRRERGVPGTQGDR